MGAVVDFRSVLALNIRSEIKYGGVMDGCTALSWHTKGKSFLAQNWDVGLLRFASENSDG